MSTAERFDVHLEDSVTRLLRNRNCGMAASSVTSSASTALNSSTVSGSVGGGSSSKPGGGAKYPNAVRPGGSEFLRRRLEKGHKFFDSGDYNMAKAMEKPGSGPHLGPILAGGGAGPAGESVGGNVAQFPSTQAGQMNRKPMHQLLPTIGDDNENPKPALSPDEIRTSKNSPPPKTSKLATT